MNRDPELPYNDLPLLPPAESEYKNVAVYAQLVSSRAALAKLQGRCSAIGDIEQLCNAFSLLEAKASVEVQYAFTSDEKVYAAFSQESIESVHKSQQEILRYREVLQSQAAPKPLSEELILEMYRRIFNLSGGFRGSKKVVHIKSGGLSTSMLETVYTPPAGDNVIPTKLANLIDFVQDDRQFPIDPLLKMAIAHYQFEAIHPFRKGNGRVGRLLNMHILLQKGLLDYPIFLQSKYLKDNKEEYFEALQSVTDSGSWNTYLLFILKAIEEGANTTLAKITSVLECKNAMLHTLTSKTNVRRPEHLVNALFKQPYSRVTHLTTAGIYAENTARNYLNELAKIGVLEKRQLRGHHYYLNSQLYNILRNCS